MSRILGISAYYHDSAAALVADGAVVAAAQEERFTRRKHDHAFPSRAIDYCLAEGGLRVEDLDYVVFYDKPYLKFDRLLETYLAYAPAGFRSFLMAMPLWLKTKLHLPREINRALGGKARGKILFTRHHESHAASAFFPSPFEEAAILTVDGVGEWETATLGTGRGNRIELMSGMQFPHSLGLLYSAFTYFTGFRVNSGEYKLMGLAPYGEPRYAETIRKELLDIREDGSFTMDMRFFRYCEGLTMTNRRFAKLFGGPPRRPESPLTQREMDLAASVQVVTEDILLRMARHARETTGMRYLCLAGGVALNCVANGKIRRSGNFDEIWIQPAAGDAGGALGAALFVHHQLLEGKRTPDGRGDSMHGAYLGPAYGDDDVHAFLRSEDIPHRRIDDETELLDHVAAEIEAGKVVGWFHGRMEFGPRALGARSILGDPRNPSMQSTMNLRIKFRESFRPFAPCVLRERAAEIFGMDNDSPYMLEVADVLPEHRTPLSDPEKATMQSPDLRERVNVVRSAFPAITHVDYSARVQTVDAERHGRFYRLLKVFEQRTGCPVLINTSFNVRGEPIVRTPQDAYRCFMLTDMDVLVLGTHILHKSDQPGTSNKEREAYRAGFELD
ncbi:MAG: carbamoyltransferase [Opitutales bacterium]|nr:carbamoyltransferase [Opitutales bacterium]